MSFKEKMLCQLEGIRLSKLVGLLGAGGAGGGWWGLL